MDALPYKITIGDKYGPAMTIAEQAEADRSPEPDGHFRHYFLRVHPELRPLPPGTWDADKKRDYLAAQKAQALTARNAVASLHGLRGDQYAPLVET